MSRWTNRFEQTLLPLALVTAGIHLYWGIPRFTNYVSVGVMPDPRPALFVLSGHAILAAITLVLLGVVDKRWTYLPGMALMAAHLVGYAAWHTADMNGGWVPTAKGLLRETDVRAPPAVLELEMSAARPMGAPGPWGQDS